MTPIQAGGLPAILEGRDLPAQEKTGSGKRAAFAIDLLHRIEARTCHTQALAHCPTRELADRMLDTGSHEDITRMSCRVTPCRQTGPQDPGGRQNQGPQVQGAEAALSSMHLQARL